MFNSAERSADIFSPRPRAVEERAAPPEAAAPAAAGVAVAQLPEAVGAAVRPSAVAVVAVRRPAGVAAGAQPRVAEAAMAPLPVAAAQLAEAVGAVREEPPKASWLLPARPSALHWLAAGESQHLASAGRASARQPRQAASKRQPLRGHSERPVPEAVIPAAGEQAWHWDWPRRGRCLPPPVVRAVRPWHRARAAYWPSATPVDLVVGDLERSRSAPRWRAAARSARLSGHSEPPAPRVYRASRQD